MRSAPDLKKVGLPHLEQIVSKLFPQRYIEISSREIRVGNHGSICINRRNGTYFDHESGIGGDLFDLIQGALKTDFKGATQWLRSFLGKSKPAFTKSLNKREKISTVDVDAKRRKALSIWQATIPLNSTLAEQYLRDVRRLRLAETYESLRFIPSLYHFRNKSSHPALIAAMKGDDENIEAIHCIYLDEVTGDKAKLKCGSAKLSFAPIKGKAVKLGEVFEGCTLAIGEGIEDMLSVREITGWPCWAVCGAGNYHNLHIPNSLGEIVIAADNDLAGMSKAQTFARHLISQGHTVRIIPPPDNCKDWNDYLRKQKADAATPADQ